MTIEQLSLWDALAEQSDAPASNMTLESVLNKAGFEFRGIFELMTIADVEIERAMQQYPEKRYLIYGAYLTLKPEFEMPVKAYEVHCRELLRRIVFDEPLDPPTNGEVLAFLIQCAFVIPLHNKPGALLSKLFQKEFPDAVFDGIEMLDERYEGETDDLYQEIVDRLKFKRMIPVERVPYQELLQIERAEGYPDGWADEQNVLQVQQAREVN